MAHNKEEPPGLIQLSSINEENTTDKEETLYGSFNSIDSVSPLNQSVNKYGFVIKTKPPEPDTLSIKSYKSTRSTFYTDPMANNRLSVNSTSSLYNFKSIFNSSKRKNSQLSYTERVETDNIELFAQNIPIKTIRSRELKWIDILNQGTDQWKASTKKFSKLKEKCSKGIPQSMRSRVWMELSGASKLKSSNQNYYQKCLSNSQQINIASYITDIQKDLHRQFPSHELFMKQEGQDMLFNVLKAYAVHYPEIGYCQAQCPLAAVLLTQMPEEDAFWMLVKISDEYLSGYFKAGLDAVNVDGNVLQFLLKKQDKFIFQKLVQLEINPHFYMMEWFMCVYSRSLPWCNVLRVWDMFLCEGKIVLFKIGIYLIREAFRDSRRLEEASHEGVVEVLDLLKNSMTLKSLKEENFVKQINFINLTYQDLKHAKKKIYGKNHF